MFSQTRARGEEVSRRKRLAGLCATAVAAVAAVAVAGAFAVTGSNTITTVAGTGEPGFSGDNGPATSAQIYRPAGLAFDGHGNMYIADLQNDRIRKINTAGIITTFAGGGSIPGSDIGDGGPATLAELFVPESVAVDGAGNVYIADRNNQRIRKVNTAGTITTFAGGGGPLPPGDIGDGRPATSAILAAPAGVTVDTQGNVYIGDRDHMRIRKVDTSGIITTITSAHDPGPYPGDGLPAIVAKIFGPYAVAVDGQGSLYIAEYNGSRVRKVDAGSQSNATITFDPLAPKTYGDPDFTVSATASTGLPVSFTASGNCTVGGTTVHITGAGSCTITASQPGDVNNPPAPNVSRTFSIGKASQTITFTALANKRLGDPDFTVSARASSGLPVLFIALGRCTVTGTRVHLTGRGLCTITAVQPGNANYGAAAAVAWTFTIGRKAQPLRCRVPRVISTKLPTARSMISKARCRTGKVTRVYSRTKRKGIVIRQSRRPGQVLPVNSKVNLVVSRGRRR